MSRNLLIVLRTCTKIYAVSTGKRYINCTKHELVNTCLSSLVDSINYVQGHNIKLVVLDDHSDQEAIDDIKEILSKCNYPTEFISVEGGTGNGYTMYKVYEQVEKKCTDLWYHVEDDYLHDKDAIQDMLDSIGKFEETSRKMVAFNPHDDIFRYTREVYPSYILLGPYRRYRTVKHTTFTCLASRTLYNKYRDIFQELAKLSTEKADWVENRTINQIWNKPDVMLFSPIPGLGFHIMDEDGKDPFFDVEELWNSIPKLWIKEKNESI